MILVLLHRFEENSYKKYALLSTCKKKNFASSGPVFMRVCKKSLLEMKKNLFITFCYIYICPVQLLNTFIDILTYTTETATATLRLAPVPSSLNP